MWEDEEDPDPSGWFGWGGMEKAALPLQRLGEDCLEEGT